MYASQRFKDDENFALIAVENRGKNLSFVSDRLKDNEKVVERAINNDGLALLYASKRLKGNRKIVQKALENSPGLYLLGFIDPLLMNDDEFCKNLVRIIKYKIKAPSVANKNNEENANSREKRFEFQDYIFTIESCCKTMDKNHTMNNEVKALIKDLYEDCKESATEVDLMK